MHCKRIRIQGRNAHAQYEDNGTPNPINVTDPINMTNAMKLKNFC
jgi:hypothetical protein